MLKAPSNKSISKTGRHRRHERQLWHDAEKYTQSLGCLTCPEHSICGGLNLPRPLLDCLDYCCGKKGGCDAVCRNNPMDYVRRKREIQGFELDNVPRAKIALPKINIPSVVPIIFHGDRRQGKFAPAAAAIPFHSIIPRRAKGENLNFEEIFDKFRISEDTPILITGTENDRPLEQWWALGRNKRRVIRMLRESGIALVTTPNYSLFTDQPRWDDLHSMKRIAISHEEFLREGIPTALHVNARTERDWDRWTEYVLSREEVTHLSFEFGTGGGVFRALIGNLTDLLV